MNEAHEKTRIRQLEDAAAHWEHKYANAREYNRNLEARNAALEARCRELTDINAEYAAKGWNIDAEQQRTDECRVRIAELEALLDQANRHKQGRGQYLEEARKRIAELEAALSAVLRTRGAPMDDEYLSDESAQMARRAHELALSLLTAPETEAELPQAPMPCPGFNSGACVPGEYCGVRMGYAYPCPGQPALKTK